MSAGAVDVLADYVCPWCEESGLIVRHRMESVRNGSARASFQGYYVGCREPITGCADTTGCFDTEAEAVAAAIDYCVEMGQEARRHG